MQATRFVFKRLASACQSLHSKRLRALSAAVESLARGRRLTLTGLGRSLKSKAKVKHNSKRMDRLLGNEKLFSECRTVYSELARWVVNGVERPLILVDWTELAWNQKYHLLRAAIPVGGRAMTIYEEVHPVRVQASNRVHRRFLQRLATILGDSCCPIVVTDAGFRGPWFEAVKEQGWDWIGRIRNTTLVCEAEADGASWIPCKTLYLNATRQARALGAFMIARSNPVQYFLYLFQSKRRGRVRKTLRGSRSKANPSLKIAAREREPWRLASSLQNTAAGTTADKVVRLYRQRMQIEESFRDMKNRNVLSTFFVGCQLIHHKVRFYEREILHALQKLTAAADECSG